MRYFHTFILILKNINTRPTKYFILLVLSIIGLFFLAYMHNYNIVYLMMFFTFALAGASSIIGRLNLYQLEASLLVSQNLFANTPSTYRLTLYNPNQYRDSFALECSNQESMVKINELKGLESKTFSLDFTPAKRGETKLPPLKIGSYFPLPHEILFREIDLKDKSIVFPQAKGISLDDFTSKSRTFFGEQEDFEGLRAFREGESLSLIHWPSFAKNSELMSKEFSLLESSRHLNFHFSQAGEDDEERLSQLCLWAIECKEKNIHYTMHFPDTTLNSRQRSHYEILRFLALY